MKDSDPRTMPPEVRGAYEDPLLLNNLLSSEVFAYNDQIDVRDTLVQKLVRDQGMAYIWNGKIDLPIDAYVSRMGSEIWRPIATMFTIDDYGGKESVLRVLAEIMQPYWLRWWESTSWADRDSYSRISWMDAVGYVLGPRQRRWIAAQCARSVIDLDEAPEARERSLLAIEAAERYAIHPSVDNQERMLLAHKDVRRLLIGAIGQFASMRNASEAMFSCMESCVQRIRENCDYDPAVDPDFSLNLARELITPTLITGPNGAVS